MMREESWKPKYAMDGLLPHVERIADLAGGTIANIGHRHRHGRRLRSGAHADRRPTRSRTSAALGGFSARRATARKTPMRSCTATPCASSASRGRICSPSDRPNCYPV